MPQKTTSKTHQQLLTENEGLRARLEEAEDTLRAIHSGEVDALVVSGADGEQVFTLTGADYPYRALIEDMGEGALTLTMDGVVLYANGCFAEMIKTPLEQVIGSYIYAWVEPTGRKILQTLLQRDESQPQQVKEIALLASDGTIVPGLLSVRALQARDMQGYFAVVVTDLTEHKRTEAIAASEKLARKMLADSKEALVKSTHRFEALFSQAPFTGAIYRLIRDDGGNITDWEITDINELGAASFGLKRATAIGKRALALFGSQAMTPYFEIVRRVAASNVPQIFETYFEASDRFYLTSIFMVDADQYVNMSIDITERKQAEEKFQTAFKEQKRLLLEADESRAVLLNVVEDQKIAEEKLSQLNAELERRVRKRTVQLEAANRELEAFAHSVSHDLRAPLRGIDGFSAALLEDYQDRLDEQGQHYLERIRSETQRMGHMIEDMLQLSRMTRVKMKREPVNLTLLAQTILDRLQETESERQVRTMINPDMVAFGDSNLLEILLTNLLSNAWKFTGKQPQPIIEFGNTLVAGQPAFFIRDNGAGFDMTYAKNLFGAFQRMHKQSDFPGTGIGLATVQRIINRHGGKVWAEAQKDQGATFYFTFEEKR
jgi:PAS domain S-box-containing protein